MTFYESKLVLIFNQRGEKLAQERRRADADISEPDKGRREEKTRDIRDVACDDPAVVAAVRRIKIQFQPLFTPENLDLILPTNIRCVSRSLHADCIIGSAHLAYNLLSNKFQARSIRNFATCSSH